MNKLLLILILNLITNIVWAYRVVIIADPKNIIYMEKAASQFDLLSPFKNYDIDIKYVFMSEKSLDCTAHLDYPYCDMNKIFKKAADFNADDIIVITSTGKNAQAAFGAAVISTGSVFNGFTVIHEYMHAAFNFSDQYAFPMYRSALICNSKSKLLADITASPNIAVLNEKETYSSDKEARLLHSKDIPWYKQILPETLITTGSKLGTDPTGYKRIGGDQKFGLYPSSLCDDSLLKLDFSFWKPGARTGIMESENVGLNFPEKELVKQILDAKGVALKPKKEEKEPVIKDTGPIPKYYFQKFIDDSPRQESSSEFIPEIPNQKDDHQYIIEY